MRRLRRWGGPLARMVVGVAISATAVVVVAEPPASASTGTLTGVSWSVSNSETGLANVTYAWDFTTATLASLSSITMTIPSGTTCSSIAIVSVYGIGAGTLSCAGTTVTYAVKATVSIAAGVPIYISASGFTNTTTAGSYTSVVTTLALGISVDTGTSPNVTFGASGSQTSVVIPESLTFTNSTPDITLLPVPGGPAVSQTVTLSVTTNAGQGYTLAASTSGITATSGSHTYTLAQQATPSTTLAPNSFAATASLSTAGTSAAALQGSWGATGEYVGYASSSSGTTYTIVSATGPTGATGDQLVVTDSTQVNDSQPAGTYTGTITYVATPTY